MIWSSIEIKHIFLVLKEINFSMLQKCGPLTFTWEKITNTCGQNKYIVASGISNDLELGWNLTELELEPENTSSKIKIFLR